MDSMIQVDGLTRVYRAHRQDKPAVDAISFEVSRGDVLGFLGPNGAGKSTTMKMLSCYLPPTAGRASVAGYDIFDQPLQVRRQIGYLPENTPLYADMTVLGFLQFTAQMRGLGSADTRRRIKKVGEVTGILDVLGKYIRELSRGYRQRVGLTQAMLHDPPVLILDEPTSHILPEVQATCNRVPIISDGVIVADGKPDELVARETKNTYRLLLASAGGPSTDDARAKLGALEGVRAVECTDSENGTLQLQIFGSSDADLRLDLFRLAAAADWPLLELHRHSASLEEVFARLTRTEASS